MCPGLWNHRPHCQQGHTESQAWSWMLLQPPDRGTGVPGAPTDGRARAACQAEPASSLPSLMPHRAVLATGQVSMVSRCPRGPAGARRPAARDPGQARVSRGRFTAPAPQREIPSPGLRWAPRWKSHCVLRLSGLGPPPPCFTDADGLPAVHVVFMEFMLRVTFSLRNFSVPPRWFAFHDCMCFPAAAVTTQPQTPQPLCDGQGARARGQPRGQAAPPEAPDGALLPALAASGAWRPVAGGHITPPHFRCPTASSCPLARTP